jgi:hypothetical protein
MLRRLRVTAPSRIPHGVAVRNAVRVEWMRLDTVADLDAAADWLADHDITTRAGFDAVWLYVPGRTVLPARLGDRLTYDPDSGEFSVWPEERYREAHQEVDA